MTNLDGLAGLAPFLLLAAAALALPVTSLLLRRYRGAVLRLMNARGAETDTVVPVVSARASRRVPDGLATELRHRRAVHVAITVGAGLFVGVAYTWLFFFWTDLEFLPFRSLFLVLMFAWPAVPGVWIATDGDRRWTLIAAGIYFAAAIGVSVIAGAGVANALLGWVLFNGLPTAVVAAFFSRAFRAVGVLVLGVMLLALTGSQAIFSALDSDEAARWVVELGFLVGIEDGTVLFLLVPIIGFVVTAAAGWWVLYRLGHWYTRHGFSDHMLLLGSMCFVFCLDYVASVANGDLGALLIGLGLFAVLAVGTLWVYGVVIERSGPVSRLLLLRVFDHGAGGSQMLTGVGARWRHIGPVRLIAGPDLASSTIEPDEFLAFTSGRLRTLFIDNGDTLTERLASIDPVSDPDGRFRVEEFFCFDNTWRSAVGALLTESDLVLMDLRGFTEQRQGSLHELQLLGHEGVFPRTVLLVDNFTDTTLVERIITDANAGRPHIHESGADQQPDRIVEVLLGLGGTTVSA